VNVTNTASSAVELGAFGLAMPAAGEEPDIEQSVYADPHVGGEHGFVEWVRCVVDEQTLLAVPLVENKKFPPSVQTLSRFEAWRPIMENTCGKDSWEMDAVSLAWADEWAKNQQYPFLYMSKELNDTQTWPNPKSPWPAWHGSDSVPITDFEGIAQPWNEPTTAVLAPGQTATFAVQLLLAPRDPRTRDAGLALAGKAVLRAVPGYVVSPSMTSATLYVGCPAGAKAVSVSVADAKVITATLLPSTPRSSSPAAPAAGAMNEAVVSIKALARGRSRVSVLFDDGTTAVAHYNVLPDFHEQISALGKHWANDAWLPREYMDPFGRSAR
jgi:hypothetical protein